MMNGFKKLHTEESGAIVLYFITFYTLNILNVQITRVQQYWIQPTDNLEDGCTIQGGLIMMNGLEKEASGVNLLMKNGWYLTTALGI